MRRYIILLLITGIVWAQTDFDKLVLKDGTTYLGEYSKIEKEIVYFKPQNAFAFQPVPVNLIKRLKLKDGDYIIGKSSKSNDTLILKDKSIFNGTLVKLHWYDNKIIFKTLSSEKIFVKISDIEELKLSDGTKVIENGILLKSEKYLTTSMGIYCGTIIYISFPLILLILYANQSPHK